MYSISQIAAGKGYPDFSNLFSQYYSPLYYFLFRKFPNIDFENLQDIVQETFIKAHEKLGTYDPDQSFFNWLIAIAINKTKDFYKKEGNRKKEDLLNYGTYCIDFEEEREFQKLIKDFIEKLPFLYQEVIHLYYFQNKKIHEIANSMNKNSNTVKTWLKRAKECLKKNSNLKKIFETF